MNECCEHNDKCRWAVGSNMPGYMPDSDVEHFANWKDARAYFLEQCERALEEVENPQGYLIERRTLDRLAKHRRTTEAQTKIGPYLYWLTRIKPYMRVLP